MAYAIRAFIRYLNNSFGEVPVAFFKGVSKDSDLAVGNMYEVFYSADAGETPESLKRKQGVVHNIDELLRDVENPEEIAEIQGSAGYYWAKLIVIKESAEALRKLLESKEGRKLRQFQDVLSIPEGSVTDREPTAEKVAQGSVGISKTILTGVEAAGAKKKNPGVFDFIEEETTSYGLISVISLQERVEEEKQRNEERLHKCKAEFNAKYSDLNLKCKVLEEENMRLRDRELRTGPSDNFYENFQNLQEDLNKSKIESAVLAEKCRNLEKANAKLELDHRNLQARYHEAFDKITNLVKRDVQQNSSMASTSIQGFTSSTFSLSDPSPQQSSFAPNAANASSPTSSNNLNSPSLSSTPSTPATPSTTSSSPRNSPSSDAYDINVPEVEMLDFQVDDVLMTNVNSTENIPGSFVPEVQMPPPNETPFEVAENRKFHHISRSSFSKFMTECPEGSKGDSIFIRKCFRGVFAAEVRAVANLTGKGQTKNEVKEKLDEKGVNYCQALFMRRIQLDKANPELQHEDSKGRLSRFRFFLSKVALNDNTSHSLKLLKQAAARN